MDTQDQDKAVEKETEVSKTVVNNNTDEKVKDVAVQTEKSPKEEASDAKAQEQGTHFEHVKESFEILCERFPKAFKKEGDCVPLKIGIFNDLKDACEGIEGLSVSKIRAALRYYTTRLRYLYCLKEGARRVGINGEDAGDVSKEHAEFAQNKFKEINGARRKKKPQKKGAKGSKDRRPQLPKLKIEDLKKGTEVKVMTSDHRSVFGTVAEDATADHVNVTLNSGMTISVSPDRILPALPRKKAQH